MSFLIHFFILFTVLFGTTVFASVGKVSLLKGEATLQREAQKTPLKNGTVLEEKDIIATAKDAQIQLVFEDKTVITLGSESELKIEEYLNDAAKPKAKFKFGEGSFKSITGQIGKTAPENFTLETKTATIGIRGTTIQGNVGRGGDTIACLSGTITVGAIGSPNVVVVPAGKSTFVAPGTPPTPPQSIKPQSSGPTPSGDTPPPPSNFSSVVNQANNNDLNDRVKEVVTSAPVYNGFVTSYSYDAQEVEHSFIGQAVSYSKHPEIGLFTFSAPAYEINPTTGALSQVSPSFSGYVYTDTGHYGLVNGYPITATPIQNTSFLGFEYTNSINNESENILYDTQGEIAIYNTSEIFLFLGRQSTSLPSSGLLYFLEAGNASSLVSQYEYDQTVMIANMSNKKVLSLYLGTFNFEIGISKLNNNASMEMKQYLCWNSATSSYFERGVSMLKGAVYGSDNQALAVSGVGSYIFQSSEEGTYVNPTEYGETNTFAFRDISQRAPISANYKNVQTLTGTLSQQNLNGTTSAFDDLSITLKKAQGTVRASSSGLTIDETNSAYIHDNYFATVSTTAFQNVEVMKDYLMAIPYGSSSDDYVSWGYWGKTSYDNGVISTSTTPFSTWVAGIQTPTGFIDDLLNPLIANNKLYNYAGNVIGSVIESGSVGAILNDATNAINLNINFGTSTIAGSMAFNTGNNNTWTVNTISANTLSNTGFTASMSGSHSSEASVSGALNGKFYGPTANNVAGAFNLTTSDADKAVGSFKAKKIQ